MIVETITVGTEYATLASLLATARSEDVRTNTRCSGLILKYSGTAVVTAKEEETNNPITVLDGSNDITETKFNLNDFSKVYLSAASEVTVDLTIERSILK